MSPLDSGGTKLLVEPDQRRAVYLDAHASTPCDPRVVEAALPFLLEQYANASSPHREAELAANAIRSARVAVADVISAEPREVIFTSGATESNNLAILGLAQVPTMRRRRLLTSSIEHKSVIEPCRWLVGRGYEFDKIAVGADGRVDLEGLAELLDESVLLVSVQAASNEVGTIQSISEVSRLAHEVGALVHCDAAQALGRIKVDVDAWGVDFLSVSGHKCYGPKGIGALFVRGGPLRSDLAPLMLGGGHEGGLRPGTLNTPGIVGFGQACEILSDELEQESKRIGLVRDWFEEAILSSIPGVRRNGSLEHRLAGNSSLTFESVEAEAIIANLPEISLSGGSACTSSTIEPSHVLTAMGLSAEQAASTLRIGIGRFNTNEELEYVVQRLSEVITRLRGA